MERASLAGFEPATRCLEGSRSIRLSYRDTFRRWYAVYQWVQKPVKEPTVAEIHHLTPATLIQSQPSVIPGEGDRCNTGSLRMFFGALRSSPAQV